MTANQERRYGIVTPKLVKLDSNNTQNLTDVISIAAGDDVSYAVKADGTVWAWGHNGTSLVNLVLISMTQCIL